MAKIDLTSFEWCELIFKGKNKAYGAYKMRADSPKRHNVAMVIVRKNLHKPKSLYPLPT